MWNTLQPTRRSVPGNQDEMMKMMQLRGPLAQVQKALDTIDTEY